MRLATDDAARRQDFIWLGPVNAPTPFEARGQAWVAGLVMVPTACVVVFMLIPGFIFDAMGLPGWMGWLVHAFLAVVIGTTLSIRTIRALGRVVTHTRPVRHHVALTRLELDAPREEPPATLERAVPADLFMEDRPEHRTTYVRTARNITNLEGQS